MQLWNDPVHMHGNQRATEEEHNINGKVYMRREVKISVAMVQAGAVVGKPEHRELVARAVLAACKSAGAQDPEVLQLVLSVRLLEDKTKKCYTSSEQCFLFCRLLIANSSHQNFTSISTEVNGVVHQAGCQELGV